MNKKAPYILLSVIALTSCSKTKLLYRGDEYNSPVFDENYYTEWSDIKDLSLASDVIGSYSHLSYETGRTGEGGTTNNNIVIGGETIDGYVWRQHNSDDVEFGYANNLSKINKKFNYGITSKLFDGRIWCDGLYQKSRVQVDKSGFAMYFPKTSLVSAKYLGFSCRGGSDFGRGEEFTQSGFKMDFTWSFYIHGTDNKYNKITYQLNKVAVPIDDNTKTVFVNISPYLGDNFDELNGAVAMSFEWKCSDIASQNALLEEKQLSDDYLTKKHHLSLMLYEIFIGDSVWYN